MKFWLIGSLCAVALFSTTKNVSGEDSGPNIPGVAGTLGLTELITLVGKAHLTEVLTGPGPFTVFGPTNDAFAALPDTVNAAIKDTTALASVLEFHVLPDKVLSTALRDELLVRTVNGQSLRVNLYPKDVMPFTVATVQCAPIDVGKVDQEASNGVIHVLNKVMIPPTGPIADTMAACDNFKTLTTALKTAGLFDTLNGAGPFTLFAPTDEAFAKLPDGTLDTLLANVTALKAVLKYHVVSGTFCSAGLISEDVTTLNTQDVTIDVSDNGVTVNSMAVAFADKSVTNGVVHVIDGVLVPPETS